MTRPTVAAGQIIGGGSYRLLSSIGLGGFGEVFLAEGPVGLVAVKVVETAAWSEREYQVFNALMVSEASFLSTLDHPSLPKLRAFFAESTRYFLVMDWVSGQTLEELVRQQQRLPLEEALKMLGQLLETLEYLHDHCQPSVVFGDLKPANVLRTFDGAYRLVDLGLATRQGACLTGDFAVYSPPYSAPERATGQASAKSHDIYSLSATTVYALTGVAPSQGATHLGAEASLRKLFVGQTLCKAPQSVQRLGQLLTLLLAGLHPEAESRATSLKPLRDALERWLELHARERVEQAEANSPERIMRGLYDPGRDC